MSAIVKIERIIVGQPIRIEVEDRGRSATAPLPPILLSRGSGQVQLLQLTEQEGEPGIFVLKDRPEGLILDNLVIGERLKFEYENVKQERIVNGLTLSPVLVGGSFDVALYDDSLAPDARPLVEITTQPAAGSTRALRMALSPSPPGRPVAAPTQAHFSSSVQTASGTQDPPALDGQPLRIDAGDIVTVARVDPEQISPRLVATAIAEGIGASDLHLYHPLSVRVVDRQLWQDGAEAVQANAQASGPGLPSTALTLPRIADREGLFQGELSTASPEAGAQSSQQLIVSPGEQVSLSYARADGHLLSWTIASQAAQRITAVINGQAIPGKILALCISDLERGDAADLAATVTNVRSGQEKTLSMQAPADRPDSYVGLIGLSQASTTDTLQVEPGDELLFQYRDTQGRSHQRHVTVLRGHQAHAPRNWYPEKLSGRTRNLLQQGSDNFLAQARCLEARLQHYRSTELSLADRRHADLIEDYLEQANEALSQQFFLAQGWSALNEAQREEIFLLDEAAVEGRKVQLSAEADTYTIDERTAITQLLNLAAKHREQNPRGEQWRGFVVSALRLRDRHVDNYQRMQKKIRIRTLLVSCELAGLMFLLFFTLWNSGVSAALVQNVSLKELIFPVQKTAMLATVDTDIRFVGNAVVGEPVQLQVKDSEAAAARRPSVEARISCSPAERCGQGDFANPLTLRLSWTWWQQDIYQLAVFVDALDSAAQEGVLRAAPGATLEASYPLPADAAATATAAAENSTEMNDTVRVLAETPATLETPNPKYLIIAGCILGAIGACFSTLMSLNSPRSSPEQFASILVTILGRPVIGFTAALVLFIALNAKMLTFEPTLTMYWLLCLVSGFSDRFVLGVLKQFGGRDKPANA